MLGDVRPARTKVHQRTDAHCCLSSPACTKPNVVCPCQFKGLEFDTFKTPEFGGIKKQSSFLIGYSKYFSPKSAAQKYIV